MLVSFIENTSLLFCTLGSTKFAKFAKLSGSIEEYTFVCKIESVCHEGKSMCIVSGGTEKERKDGELRCTLFVGRIVNSDFKPLENPLLPPKLPIIGMLEIKKNFSASKKSLSPEKYITSASYSSILGPAVFIGLTTGSIGELSNGSLSVGVKLGPLKEDFKFPMDSS
ncbi:hypothetical protein FKM82_010785 [Ascaphus truei]